MSKDVQSSFRKFLNSVEILIQEKESELQLIEKRLGIGINESTTDAIEVPKSFAVNPEMNSISITKATLGDATTAPSKPVPKDETEMPNRLHATFQIPSEPKFEDFKVRPETIHMVQMMQKGLNVPLLPPRKERSPFRPFKPKTNTTEVRPTLLTPTYPLSFTPSPFKNTEIDLTPDLFHDSKKNSTVRRRLKLTPSSTKSASATHVASPRRAAPQKQMNSEKENRVTPKIPKEPLLRSLEYMTNMLPDCLDDGTRTTCVRTLNKNPSKTEETLKARFNEKVTVTLARSGGKSDEFKSRVSSNAFKLPESPKLLMSWAVKE